MKPELADASRGKKSPGGVASPAPGATESTTGKKKGLDGKNREGINFTTSP